ncbi:hypothetical protein R6Q59_005533 [Mikania micrantha]|uniref:Uncharacterized protein n=1 Tax=Mikania micrantha TaxID=192012 RepID=A0A5N6Q2N2_9ASTR|nr:hypothetical protein E3N88_01849 [Mikania micrantha]
MGACISSHHKASATKLQPSFDPTVKPDHSSVIHPSPGTGKPSAMVEHVAVESQLPPSPSPAPATVSEFGSKEETFFDTQAWIDSDYEDEFMSVNGEFTPSRGNTPVHPSLNQGTPRLNVGVTFTDHIGPHDSTSEPSPTPTEKRRRLLDLFKESRRDKHDSNFEIVEPSNKDGKMGSDKDGLKPKSESHVGSKQGCFRSLISVRSIGKQKSPSPNLTLGGGPIAG